MIVFMAMILAALTFAFIAYPFFKPRLRPVDSATDDKLRELHSNRDTTYSMLKELEFDFQSGILTEEDYQELEERYKQKAVVTLKTLDTLGKSPGVEDEVERQIRERRRSKGQLPATTTGKTGRRAGVDEEIERRVRELRRTKGQFCHQCGARYEEGDRFCSHCGTRLRKEGRK